MLSTHAVLKLFLKSETGEKAVPQSVLTGGKSGINGNIECHNYRQILILNDSVFRQFSFLPGDLKENVVVDFDELHELKSGTEVRVGTLHVRLTFHCEPCKKISCFATAKDLLHRRGYLGSILNDGSVKVGDELTVVGKKHESIPYEPCDRIKWILDRTERTFKAKELTSAVALRTSYCRVLPRYLKRLGKSYVSRVVFGG